MISGITDAGYWIAENLLSASECAALIEELSFSKSRKRRAGQRHLMANPTVAALADDGRLRQIAYEGLGVTAVPFRATLFEKTGYANWLVAWHQDTALPLVSAFDDPAWGPWSIKDGIIYAHAPAWALARILALRIHLDASTTENGPLRVIPSSHRAGVMNDEEVANYARTCELRECLVPRGGVLAMRPLLIHSSSKARVASPRRVLHIEYADSLQLAEHIRLNVA